MNGLREAVEDTAHEFEGRWGNLEWTADVTFWRDRDVQVEVYHVAGTTSIGGIDLVRRLSTLRDADGSFEHREYMWRPGAVQGDMLTDADMEAGP